MVGHSITIIVVAIVIAKTVVTIIVVAIKIAETVVTIVESATLSISIKSVGILISHTITIVVVTIVIVETVVAIVESTSQALIAAAEVGVESSLAGTLFSLLGVWVLVA